MSRHKVHSNVGRARRVRGWEQSSLLLIGAQLDVIGERCVIGG